MIAATDIGELIRNPALTANYNPVELEEIRNKYPYCSTLHLLYLKSISLTNDLQFEEHLRFSAAHIIDREQMYYLVHSGEKENTDEISSAEIQEIKSIEPIQVEQEAKTQLTEQTEISEKNDQISETEPVSQKDAVKDEPTPTEFADKKNQAESSSINELIESAPDLLDIAYEAEMTDASENEKIISVEEKDLPSQQIQPSEISEIVPLKQPEIKEPVDISKLSFAEWLMYKQNKSLPTSQAGKKVEDKPTAIPEDKAEQKTETKAGEAKNVKRSGLARIDVDALLNKFISEEPSISRPQANFFSPVKNAKQSVEESPDLVTETLAKIYILQKNFSKAIQAYEQLSLVYPEKKTFFATQIKKIKEEQNKQSKQ